MLIIVMSSLLLYWNFFLSPTPLPADSYEAVELSRDGNKPSNRKFRTTIPWQPAVKGNDNPFSSVFLTELARKQRQAERQREQEKEKAKTEPKAKPKTKPETESKPKPKPPFIVKEVTLIYRGTLSRTDGQTIAILQLPSGEVTHVIPEQTIINDILVESFTRNMLEVMLPNGTNAVIEAGQKKTLNYKIPRENEKQDRE